MVPVDEPTLEAEKLSFSNGFLRFFEADIFSFSLNFFTIIFDIFMFVNLRCFLLLGHCIRLQSE